MKYIILFISALFLVLSTTYAQVSKDANVSKNPSDSIRIDKIEISKNWMTWDLIIRKELLFEEGDLVSYGQIDTSITQIWNIGNFADVNYSIDNTPEGNVMKIEATDGMMFFPVVAIDHSSADQYNYILGYGDDNFLGSNSKFLLVWDKRPFGATWNSMLLLPRQLLYKNMTLELGLNIGSATTIYWDRNIEEVDGKKTGIYEPQLMAPTRMREFYSVITNPWHKDYGYRFSPDLSLGYQHHIIDHSMLLQEDLNLGIHVPEDTLSFFNLGVSESVGLINKQRHRLDGYQATLSYDMNFGLNGTKSYHTFDFLGEYHKIFNDLFQFSSRLNVGYTNAYEQFKYIGGQTEIFGLRYGELYGNAYYHTYLGGHFTWFNSKWFTLENAYFVNWGNGKNNFKEMLTTKQKFSVGTYFRITSPMAPWIAFRFSFMYAGPGSEWFNFVM